jgi:hypothetical protein
MKMAFVFLGNKKEDPVVETQILNIKNNVILPVNVDTQAMIILYLEHAKNYPLIKTQVLQIKIHKNPHNQFSQVAIPIVMIAVFV